MLGRCWCKKIFIFILCFVRKKFISMKGQGFYEKKLYRYLCIVSIVTLFLLHFSPFLLGLLLQCVLIDLMYVFFICSAFYPVFIFNTIHHSDVFNVVIFVTLDIHFITSCLFLTSADHFIFISCMWITFCVMFIYVCSSIGDAYKTLSQLSWWGSVAVRR